MKRCALDPQYFFEEYWSIQVVGKDSGWQRFKLRPYQVEDLSELHAAAVAAEQGVKSYHHRLKARQIGWTTLGMGFAFHNAWFNDNHPWLNTAQSEGDAQKALQLKAKMPYSMLPHWMRVRGPALKSDNMEEMEFDNGSYLLSIPSTSSAGRGQAVFGTIMDEAAFMQNAEELFGAVNPMTYGLMLMFSTANGMGDFFHKIDLDSQLPDSEWTGGFHPWSVVEERDEEWYERTKRAHRAQPWVFYQEHPSSRGEAYAKSGRTAWDLQVLEAEMDFREPLLRLDLVAIDFDKPTEPQLDGALILPGQERELELHVWELPAVERHEDGRVWREPNFVLSVDVAEGLAHGDATAVSVLNANTGEQVASFVGQYPVDELDDMLEWLGYWYYTALIAVERNSVGLVPIVGLKKKQYPRLFRMDKLGLVKSRKAETYGWITSAYTKPKMVLDFGKAITENMVLLHDARFLYEAGSFVADKRGIFNAVSGQHDDAIMATLIGVQAMEQVGMFPVVWEDDTETPMTFSEVFGHLYPNLGRPKGGSWSPIGQENTRSAGSSQGWMVS